MTEQGLGNADVRRIMNRKLRRNYLRRRGAIDLKRGLDRGVKAAIAALRQMSRPVKTRKEKAQYRKTLQ